MYLSYVDRIRRNLAGEPGSVVQPVAAVVNCTLWVALGLFRRPRDWPPRLGPRDWAVALASAPGVVLGSLAVATAL